MLINDKKDLARAYKEPYAWPGGYPVYLLLRDGALLCRKCFKGEYRSIIWDLDNKCNTGWSPYGIEALYEGPEYCGHCGEKLESAYGDIDFFDEANLFEEGEDDE